MLKDTLIILLFIALIILVIALIVLIIKFIGTLMKADILIDNVTKKAESLDGVFAAVDNFSAIGTTVVSAFTGVVKKLFKGKEEAEDYE